MHPVLILGGIAAAAAAALIYKKTAAPSTAKQEAAPPAPPTLTPKAFDLSKALQLPLDGRSVVVRPGTSLQVSKSVGGLAWADPGVVSSNDTVLAPSVPTTITGFVALKEGTALLTGYYFDDAHELQRVAATVTVSATA
jgi:hypothetical protein